MELSGYLSIIVPTFNEQRRIEGTVRAIHACVPSLCAAHEILVADDGSVDATSQIVTRLMAEGLPVRLLTDQTNRGKGSAVRRGVAASTGDLVLMTDADLSTPIQELDRFLNSIRAGADIAIGSRGLPASRIVVHQPRSRELLGRTFNLLVRMAILPGIRDTQCGFKLLRGSVARTLFARSTIDGFAFDAEILAMARRAGYKIAEVPVHWSHMNRSRVRPGRDGLRMLRDLIKISHRTDAPGVAPARTHREDVQPSLASENP